MTADEILTAMPITIPTGTIHLICGTPPPGFVVLCDGTDGTPDLRPETTGQEAIEGCAYYMWPPTTDTAA
jgi:hypothetical protein